MAALTVHHLTKKFGNVTAVNDISFTIAKGEFFGFLGPNGAGKTTAIGCATGLVNPDGGTIEVFGHNVVTDYRAARRSIGLSPQEFNVDIFRHPFETLVNNAGYFGMARPAARDRATELLHKFSLWPQRFQSFQSLSGGQKRRLMLARALIHKPKLLILDEPTAGVDVELRYWLWRELKCIQKEGTTVLLTTHYLEEAEQLCDRLAIINHGQLILIEETAALLKRYGQKKLEQIYLELTGSNEAENAL